MKSKLDAFNSRFKISDSDYAMGQGWEVENESSNRNSTIEKIMDIKSRHEIFLSTESCFETYLQFENCESYLNEGGFNDFIKDKAFLHYQNNKQYDFENFIEKILFDAEIDQDLEWLKSLLQTFISETAQISVDIETKISRYPINQTENLIKKFENFKFNTKAEVDIFVRYYIEMSTYKKSLDLMSVLQNYIDWLVQHQLNLGKLNKKKSQQISKKAKPQDLGTFQEYSSLFMPSYKGCIKCFSEILQELEYANETKWYGKKYLLKIFYQEMVKLNIMHDMIFKNASYLFKDKFNSINISTVNSSLSRVSDIEKIRKEIVKVTNRILKQYDPNLPIFHQAIK